ncbi:hypothetical protein [Methylobacterium trifolii]|uniref:DUF2946 domain-containing protein n=1 Tax=Methylobacterium trifolii TaxID=1003092 RepID=A0ABQ4U156_9HYPH|nr:hypothetical protein [Methylobacterium trifolii]GJE61186.1 hypothetical protein MPOCJGCO_3307 [Methylobacterium trifolii]
MRPALLVLGLILGFCALFLRSYTLPPAPDRQGGTTLSLDWPTRPVLGSPRADCLGTPEAEPVIACLIASVNRARSGGIPLLSLRFCAPCHDWSQRIALLGRDEAAAQARLAQIARFGW